MSNQNKIVYRNKLNKVAHKPRRRMPCKKILMPWTTTEMSELISIVKRYPCLYQEKFEHGMFRPNRIESWELVAKAMNKEGATPDQCQAKWNSIRGSYRRMLPRSFVLGVGKEFPRTAWPHFDEMAFLRPHIKLYQTQEDLIYIKVC